MSNTEIGERLIEIRKALNINQGLFAAKLGFASGNGLSMIEKGRNPLRETHCKILEYAFNVNIEWLKTGNGKPFLSDFEQTIPDEVKDYKLKELQRLQQVIEDMKKMTVQLIDKSKDDTEINRNLSEALVIMAKESLIKAELLKTNFMSEGNELKKAGRKAG